MDYFEMTQKAVDFIEEHLDERIQVYDLARLCLCSDAHFSRIFRAIVGLSVMDYMRGRRLSLAARELALAQAKVLDVALKYGYDTPESFTKAFKKFHGASPIACRRSGAQRYLERSFPLVAKMKLMEGARNMKNFGSPLEQLIQDLDKQSANMYFCFNVGTRRYAIQALEVWSIMPPCDLHLNTEGKLFQFLWGHNRPVVWIDEMIGLEEITEGEKNILQCRAKDAPTGGNATTVGKGVFGLIIDGNPELKIVQSIAPTKITERPFISHIGQFENEEIPIICNGALWSSQSSQLADTFDIAENSPTCKFMEKDSPQKRLEYAAFTAELLARNASIEAANGMGHHKGTMVVAHELHQHAMNLAKIASELREQQGKQITN